MLYSIVVISKMETTSNYSQYVKGRFVIGKYRKVLLKISYFILFLNPSISKGLTYLRIGAKWSMQSQIPCRRVGLGNGGYSAAHNSRLQRTHKRSKYNQSSSSSSSFSYGKIHITITVYGHYLRGIIRNKTHLIAHRFQVRLIPITSRV